MSEEVNKICTSCDHHEATVVDKRTDNDVCICCAMHIKSARNPDWEKPSKTPECKVYELDLDEVFKEINGFETYIVSNRGRVQNSETGRLISSRLNDAGYLCFTVRQDGISRSLYTHRVVAEAFIEDFDGAYKVCFKDDDPNNCRVDNLYQDRRKKVRR